MRLNFVILIIFLLLSAILSAGIVQKTFSFPLPQFSDYEGYDRVNMAGLTFIMEPGNPELPSLPVHLLLPPGEAAVYVEVISDRSEILEGSFNIFPAQRPYPMSYQGDIPFEEPAADIYGSDRNFPEELTTEWTTQFLRGHSIALFNLFPLQFNPHSGELILHRDLQVIVHTEPAVSASDAYHKFYRSDEQTRKRVGSLVQNSDEISVYPLSQNLRENDDYEYIIIAPNQFLNQLNQFIQFKIGQGYHVFTKTTEDIYSEYTGVDNADKIRNFIIDAYQDMGAEYVLLAGDVNLVPHRGFWINAGGTEDYNIPSDLYYEGLDRVGTGAGPDWNTNNNTKWGENQEADYLAEVHVGRISAENITELSAALNKQMMYQDEPVIADLEKALMVGENLNNSPLTWGATYKDEIISGGNFNGYTTVGIPPNITVDTLYERDSNWSATNLRNKMNNGLNIINHLGHSNTDYNMKFYNSTVTNQNITANGVDHNYFVIYSQGCLPAAIDTDCIAERFTTIDNGCAAYVGNTRYGWYMPGGTNSSSQYMDRQFFNALYNGTASKVSELNTVSKEVGVAQCASSDWFRWSYYCLLVLGDPTLDIWSATPSEINAVYQPAIPLGTTQIAFETDAPFARIGLTQNGELIGRVVADQNGDALLETFESILTAEEITVSMIAHDRIRHLGTILAISNEPYVIFESYEVDDSSGNNDGQPDYSESIALDMTLKNVGSQPASGVSALISTTDIYVTITNAAAVFGDFGINASVTVPAAFSLDIADDVPDQHIVNFDLEVTDNGNETWFSSFQLIINAPQFFANNLIINDLAGNNNGILDPGETVTFIINTENIGHSMSPEAMAALVTDNDLITIDTPILNLGAINAQSNVNAIFSVTADAALGIGEVIEFNYAVLAGSYYYERIYQHQVGLILEDFETGDFSAFPWEFSGNADWIISDGAYEGSFCAMSSPIGHNENATIMMEIDVAIDGQISFWRTVSSEPNYDYLRFYIDGIMLGEWSGDVTWGQEVYDITAGTHLVEWKYIKDQYVVGGTDRARIDYIIFPPLGVIFPAMINIEPGNFTLEMPVNSIAEEILQISNIGGDSLNYSITSVNSPDWMSFDPDSGSLTAGQMDEITITLDTNDLTAGSYYTGLLVNDGLEGQNLVTISLLVTGTGNDENLLPVVTELMGNYPNPFNPVTNIRYGLSSDSKVLLNIYNLKGQKVKTLINEKQKAGYHNIAWNGLQENGNPAASGVYFYELFVEETDYTSVKKMILLK